MVSGRIQHSPGLCWRLQSNSALSTTFTNDRESCREINIRNKVQEGGKAQSSLSTASLSGCSVCLTGTAKQNSVAEAGNKNRKHSKHPATWNHKRRHKGPAGPENHEKHGRKNPYLSVSAGNVNRLRTIMRKSDLVDWIISHTHTCTHTHPRPNSVLSQFIFNYKHRKWRHLKGNWRPGETRTYLYFSKQHRLEWTITEAEARRSLSWRPPWSTQCVGCQGYIERTCLKKAHYLRRKSISVPHTCINSINRSEGGKQVLRSATVAGKLGSWLFSFYLSPSLRYFLHTVPVCLDLAKATRGYLCVIILLAEPSSEILSNSSVWSSPSCAMTQNVSPGRKLGLDDIYFRVQDSLPLCSLLSSVSEHPFRHFPSSLAAYAGNSAVARNRCYFTYWRTNENSRKRICICNYSARKQGQTMCSQLELRVYEKSYFLGSETRVLLPT